MQIRHQVVPSVYLVAMRDGKVLLGERQNTGYCDGCLGLPSGHVEQGENPLQAIMREAKEEVDLNLTADELRFAAVMPRLTRDRECVDYFFIAEVIGKNLNNNEPTKCKFWEFYPINDLPANVMPYVRRAIQGLQNNESYIQYGWIASEYE